MSLEMVDDHELRRGGISFCPLLLSVKFLCEFIARNEGDVVAAQGMSADCRQGCSWWVTPRKMKGSKMGMCALTRNGIMMEGAKNGK